MSDEAAEREHPERVAHLDLRNILSAEDGRRFLWGLIDELCGVYGPSFSGEATHAAAYREGRRSVGIDLLELCQRVDSAGYVHMVDEALSRRRAQADTKREQDDAG